MIGQSENEGDEAVEEQAPKRKARDNPWYRLATLHGEQARHEPSRQDKVFPRGFTA
jgi:hypothetical protein